MSQFGGGDEVILLFPGALGDFLCFGAALAGLRESTTARIKVVARPESLELLQRQQFDAASIDARFVSELFGGGSLDAARALFGRAARIWSWTGYGDAQFDRRLRSLCDLVEVFPFRNFAGGEHASEYYARCLGVSPVPLALDADEAAANWAQTVLAPLEGPCLVIHPGSGAVCKNWTGFGQLAESWRRRGGSVVAVLGPAEEKIASPHHVDLVVRETLPRVAALLRRAIVYAGNDSGISHLAAAAGAHGIAMFGTDDVAHWRPRSNRIAVVEASQSCDDRCEVSGICLHRLPVAVVAAAVDRAWTEAQRWQVGQ